MAEVIELKTDYDEQTAELTISQFRKEKYLNKLNAFNDQLIEIETVIQQLLSETSVDTAIGAQLDVVGRKVNINRDGRIDPVFRDAIKQRIALRFSGTPEAIIEIILALYGGTFVIFRNTYPGKFHVTTDAIIISDDLIDITPAGVGGYVETDCLIDALDNFILDANGNNICMVIVVITTYIVDAQNNSLVDANGNFIIIFEQE